LKWFKDAIRNSVDRIVEKRVDMAVKELEQEKSGEVPYLNVKLVNDVLTVVLNNGDVISKINATSQDYHNVKNASSIEEIESIMTDIDVYEEKVKRELEFEKMKTFNDGFDALLETGDFELKEGSIYLKGIDRSLPQLLVEKFVNLINFENNFMSIGLENHDEYQGLKRFFMWCCLNPRAEVADKLYDFLSKNGMKVTKQGLFVALRNVVTVHGGDDFVHFISNAYNKVKAVWKKSPNDYTIFIHNGEYKLVHKDNLYENETMYSTECRDCDGTGLSEDWEENCAECEGDGQVEQYTYNVLIPINHGEEVGILTDLYLDLPNRNENRFTDNWSGTFDIRIGQAVSMPKEDCNWSTQDCATAGLHFAGYTAPYVLCGDTTVFTLINPMKVVGIGTEKGRCYEYLPFMTTTVQEADEIMNDGCFDFLQLDEEYAINELSNLVEKVKEGFSVEVKKYDYNLPNLNTMDLNNIVKSLEDMKSTISNRVSNI
jgi:hypothetical protein